MKMEPIEGSETSAVINQTPGNYPKGNLIYSVHGESLKSRIIIYNLRRQLTFISITFLMQSYQNMVCAVLIVKKLYTWQARTLRKLSLVTPIEFPDLYFQHRTK